MVVAHAVQASLCGLVARSARRERHLCVCGSASTQHNTVHAVIERDSTALHHSPSCAFNDVVPFAPPISFPISPPLLPAPTHTSLSAPLQCRHGQAAQ
jgi:hypothetical protein